MPPCPCTPSRSMQYQASGHVSHVPLDPSQTLDLPTTFTKLKMSDVKKSNSWTIEEVYKEIMIIN